MKLKIKNEKIEDDEYVFWLEREGDDLMVMSKQNKQKSEFRIMPDGSWWKCHGGNLKTKEK